MSLTASLRNPSLTSLLASVGHGQSVGVGAQDSTFKTPRQALAGIAEKSVKLSKTG